MPRSSNYKPTWLTVSSGAQAVSSEAQHDTTVLRPGSPSSPAFASNYWEHVLVNGTRRGPQKVGLELDVLLWMEEILHQLIGSLSHY